MYQILGSSPVPNYRKCLKGMCNKANLTNYISNYIVENEHIPHGKLIILVVGFSIGKLVKNVTRYILFCHPLNVYTVTLVEPTGELSCMLPVCQGPIELVGS